ncbi:MAG: PspA/IM30 family protein [bacterium]|jgi:phage shock protein A|nr:PspA/IM30 family protein [bacterium]
MGIIKRIASLLKSNINDLLDKAEDPEKTLNQIIRDMEQCLRDAKIEVCRTVKHKKKLETSLEEHREQVGIWQENAELAIKRSDDELARQALVKKRSYSTLEKQLTTQLEQQTEAVETLKKRLQELDTKIDEYKRRRDLLVARQKNVEAQKKIQVTLNGISDPSLFDAFDRMEDKVLSMERQNEAIEEVNAALPPRNLEDKFSRIRDEENEKEVTQELVELKERLEREAKE